MGKYLKAVKFSSQITFSYNKNFLISSIIQICSLLITIFMWKAVFHFNNNSIEEYSLTDMIIYIFIVNTVFDLIGSNNVSERVSNDIRSGQLSIYLMRPYPHVLALFFDLIGNKITKIPMILVMNGLVGSFVLYYSHQRNEDVYFNFSAQSVVMFLFFLLFSFFWNYIFDYLLGLVAFWMDNPWILFYIKGHVTAVFCGLIIPLNLFPNGVQKVLDYLPFQYYVFFPYQILSGNIGFYDYLTNLACFLGWILAFMAIMLIVWIKSINRFTAVGG